MVRSVGVISAHVLLLLSGVPTDDATRRGGSSRLEVALHSIENNPVVSLSISLSLSITIAVSVGHHGGCRGVC